MVSNKAVKAILILEEGGLELAVFQLPDGKYNLSMTQVAEAVDNTRLNKSFTEFLNGKSPEALPYKGYNFTEVLTEGVGGHIKGVTFDIAVAYWAYQARKGSMKALALVSALAKESLEKRADKLFGVVKSELQYQQQTSISIQQFEVLFTMLQEVRSELKLLRPAYEELQTLNKAFKEVQQLKPLLEEIAKVINTPNQKTKTIREWLKLLEIDVSSSQCKAIGKVVADWLKVGQMENYVQKSRPAKYPEALVPLVKLATEYKLFHAK